MRQSFGHMNNSTVHVVDDDPTVLESVQHCLHSAGIRIRGHHSAEEFIRDGSFHDAACLILDLRMPGMTGMNLIEWLRAKHIEIPVIVLSGHGDIPAVVDSMKLGAVEFIEKPANDRMLLNTVSKLLQAETLRCNQRAKTREIRENFATLTDRENEVVELLATGLSSKQIAARVGITPKTVENHRSHILAKTRAGNVASLVRMKMLAADHSAIA
jgi:two-component system, LuxR family, response regulator FixJ